MVPQYMKNFKKKFLISKCTSLFANQYISIGYNKIDLKPVTVIARDQTPDRSPLLTHYTFQQLKSITHLSTAVGSSKYRPALLSITF